MSDRRPTIVDIARRLGVSHSTVSRAFTRPHLLRPETVVRIRELAAELGYVPNRSARALSTGRSGVIGLLVPDLTNPFFPPLIRAAQRAAERHGVAVYVGESDDDPARELALLDRFERQVDGVVLASSRLSDRALAQVTARFPAVLINRDLEGHDRVLLPAGDALRHAIAGFAAQGGRRVLYVGGPRRSWSEQERRSAIVDASRGEDLEVEVVACAEGTYRASHRLGVDLGVRGGDLVIAFDDVIAHGLFDALTSRGFRVPHDLLLLGCDGTLPVETSPRLPTVRLAAADAGRRAAEMLLREGPPGEAERVEIRGRLLGWDPAGRTSAAGTPSAD